MKKSGMHKTAMVGKKHGSPMSGGGQHQVAPMKPKSNPERRGVAKTGKGVKKMTAM